MGKHLKEISRLNVLLDYIVGNSSLIAKDKNIMERLEGIANMPSTQKTELFNVIDAYLRDFITRQAYIGH